MPIAQAESRRRFYTSVLIVPAAASDDPVAAVQEAGTAISYVQGASSGESGARAASAGAASVRTNNHEASVNAVKVGRAKAAFVKNWWWEDNKDRFPGMKKLEYPGVSDHQNPDYVLSVNRAVPPEDY